MASTFEYMQMATGVYAASKRNEIGIPSGWSRIDWQGDRFTGFSAGIYQNDETGEIVISYTGTNDKVADPLNWTAGLGIPAPQIFEAMSYYFEFRTAHPEATNISFTGHSLGGGLASLMAVFFDKQAIVFDEAPFQLAASSAVVLAGAAATMAASGYLDEELAVFLASGGLLALTRESNVTQHSIEGEVLSYVRLAWRTLVGTDVTPVSLGDSNASMIERHSMALLTALTASEGFLSAVGKLPDLVMQLADEDLFAADPRREDKTDLLRQMIANQLGIEGKIQPNEVLDRFAADMEKIAQEGGLTMANNDLTKALTAFAMQAYYDNRLATDATLFESVIGGIRFDRGDVADTLDDVKGYDMYFKNYLQTLPAEESPFVEVLLPNLLDWFIQAGGGGMNATAGDQAAFMLGGSGDDTLTGGGQADVLIGNGGADTLSGGGSYDYLFGGAGNDTLTGGAGSDTLFGGKGFDTYIWNTGDGNDTIMEEREADGKIHGIIKINNGPGIDFIAAGGFVKVGTSSLWEMTVSDGSVLSLTQGSSWKLVMSDGSALELGDFQDGDYGMRLYEKSEAERTLLGDDADDQNAFYYNNSTWYYYFSGDISGTDIITGAINCVLDGWERIALSQTVSPSLDIEAGGGNDRIFGLAGEDEINGGSGNDAIAGDAMILGAYPNLPAWNGAGSRDLLRGEAGRDVLLGWKGDDLLLGGEDGDFLSGEQDDDVLDGGSGNDLLAGGSEADQLLGGSGNDVLYGDRHIDQGDQGYFYVNNIDVASWGIEIDYDQQGRISSLAYSGFDIVPSLGAGDDLLAGGSGNDYLDGGGGSDTLFGDDGHDCLYGDTGSDSLDGGTGNDLLTGEAGNDTLFGGKGADGLRGGDGDDVLYGGGDSDFLFGEAGSDILNGESGNEYLDGGDDDDIYLFGFGSGHDTVFDSGSSAGDTVRFADGVSPEDVSLCRFQDHLIVSLGEGQDSLSLGRWFTDSTKVERFEFADGTVWTDAAARSPLTTGFPSISIISRKNSSSLVISGHREVIGPRAEWSATLLLLSQVCWSSGSTGRIGRQS